MTPLEALNRAVELCDGQTELARRIAAAAEPGSASKKVVQAHVWNWVQAGKVPAEHCRSIEAATDGKVTRYQLRPDVFGPVPKSTSNARAVAAR